MVGVLDPSRLPPIRAPARLRGRTSIHDWHATILHLMGLDHERLTFNYAGRDFRLTDVHGEVARDILA